MARTRGEKNGWFVTVVAAVLFTISGGMALNNLWFLRSAVRTDGIVVSNRKENIASRGGEYSVYFPAVEFFDLQGAARRIEPSTGTTEPTPIGTTLPVLYPRGDPANARVGSSFLWNWPVGLALFALFVLMFGCFLIVLSRRLVKWGVPMRT
jgi:hypothetical protein